MKQLDIDMLLHCELHEPVEEISLARVSKFIKQGANINFRGDTDNTALSRCGHEYGEELITLLLKNGADINALNADRHTLIVEAIYNRKGGQIKVAKFIDFVLKSGANVNATISGGYTPLMVAVMANKVRLVRVLLDNNADTTIREDSGMTVFELFDGREAEPESLLFLKDYFHQKEIASSDLRESDINNAFNLGR